MRQQLAHVFLQGKNLSKSPLIGESLAGRFIGAFLFPMNFPGGRQVCGGCLVLGYVKRGAAGYEVPPIPGAHVVACTGCVSAGGGDKSVSGVEVYSLPKVPTQIQWLDIGVGKTRSPAASTEVRPADISYKGASRM